MTAKPYYQDELVTLYHGDCLEIDAWLTADVLVTDPPYGIRYNSRARRETLASSIIGDDDTTTRDAVLAAWGSAPALVFGAWRASRRVKTRAAGVGHQGRQRNG